MTSLEDLEAEVERTRLAFEQAIATYMAAHATAHPPAEPTEADVAAWAPVRAALARRAESTGVDCP